MKTKFIGEKGTAMRKGGSIQRRYAIGEGNTA